MQIKIKETFKKLIPMLSDEEFNSLEKSLINEGCRDAIVLWNGFIIDGHHRYTICTKHKIKFTTIKKYFENENDVKVWMINNQMARRNITNYVRVELALLGKNLISTKAKENQKAGVNLLLNSAEGQSIDTRKKLAVKANVGTDTVNKVERIQAALKQKPDDKLQNNLRSGVISINQAFKRIIAPENRQKRVEKILSKNKSLNSLTGSFNVIYADPPWRYEQDSASSNRGVENHYPTMALDEICNLDINDIAADDCILFLWTPSPIMNEAVKVIEAWGFQYKTSAVWNKESIGMGFYFRQQHELLLVAVKGDMPTPPIEHRHSSVYCEKRTQHSKKPDYFRDLIYKMYLEYPKVELFARSQYEGWSVWGNESDK